MKIIQNQDENNLFPDSENLYLYFKSGNNKYAIQISEVLEVLKLPKLDYPQKLANNIVGLLNYNNFTINVLDLRFYLKIKVTPYTEAHQLIIVKTDETMFALIVDKIKNIIKFEKSRIEPVTFTNEEKIIEFMYQYKGENISVLNLGALERKSRNSSDIADFDIQSLFPQDDSSKYKLLKRANALSEKSYNDITELTRAKNKYVSFTISNINYCINVCHIKNLLKNANITPIPCAPDYIKGLITIHGDFVTIVNLRTFFNIEEIENKNESNNIIIVEGEDYNVGFAVDEIKQIIDIAENIEDKQYQNEKNFIKSEVLVGENLYEIIDIKKILADERFFIN